MGAARRASSGASRLLASVFLLAFYRQEATALGPWTSKQSLYTSGEAEGASGLGSPHKEINFEVEKTLTEDYHATMKAFVQKFERQQLQLARTPGTNETVIRSQLLENLIGSLDHNRCGINESSSPVRENLVVLPAGDSFDASKWMSDPKRSNWDIMLIYYGKNRFFRCPLCKAVYRASGAKWRLAWGFTLLPEWQEYRKQYRAIMFADDDLGLDICVVNTVFSVMKAYDLLAAQPSLCDADGSFTPWKPLYQKPENILRYTTMNEIMAPTFEMDYFQNFIRPSLYNAYVGWGLDFVWPFLLKYPRDKLAVVDQVCMFHPPSQPNKRNSVYSAASPFKKKEEETRRFAEYGYYESETAKLGFEFMAVEIVGAVPRNPNSSQSWLPPCSQQGDEASSCNCAFGKIGWFFPLLLLLQSSIIAAGCLFMSRKKLWGPWRPPGLRREGLLRSGAKHAAINGGSSFAAKLGKKAELIQAKF